MVTTHPNASMFIPGKPSELAGLHENEEKKNRTPKSGTTHMGLISCLFTSDRRFGMENTLTVKIAADRSHAAATIPPINQ